MKILIITLALASLIDCATAQTNGELTASFTTINTGAGFSPNHVIAAWVIDANNNTVKTLMGSTSKRAKYLTAYNKAAAAVATTDATTGATFTSHALRSLSWNGTNASGTNAPDGEYRLMIEFTESNASGYLSQFPFTKGKKPVMQTALKGDKISGVSIIWSPK